MTRRRIVRASSLVLALLIVGAIVAPYLDASGYGQRLQNSLSRSLGRDVEIGQVRFSLWRGPAFVVERGGSGPGLVIHEDPSIGFEPVAYVETVVVRPRFFPLLVGRFQIASIQLEDVSLNLTRAADGRWNFANFIDRTVMSTAPAIHVRNGRVNFKFGDTKSIVYLTDTDFDLSPPLSRGGGWKIYCAARPARTDRPSYGLGGFTLQGRWFVAPESVDLDLIFDRTGLGEWTALLRGQSGAVHGSVTSRLHLGGPIHEIGIQGRLTLADVHRWDLLPPSGQGWPLDIRGKLNLLAQELELQTTSAGSEVLPLSIRFRASNYLSRPHWAASINWNRFPAAPLLDLAAHMGAQVPEKLKLAGTLDGALSYAGEGGLQGAMAFHDAAVTIPDSPAVRFGTAYLVFGGNHARLSPAVVRTSENDEAQIEADYAMDANTLDLAIHADAMKVASLRAQVALAAVPWLEQIKSGEWSGDLRFHRDSVKADWAGRLSIHDARIDVPGFAEPVELASARAQIDGARVVVDQIDGEVGKVAFGGEYRYEPNAARPHRVRFRVPELDAADLEAVFLPTLQRDRSIFARALGRASVPDWLAQRSVEGTLQVDDLTVGDLHASNLRTQLRWDVTRIDLENLQAKIDRAVVTGKLVIGIRGAQPTYRATGQVKGLNWQSGKVDVEGKLETSGAGRQLLANLTSEATFTGSSLDFGALPLWKSVSGTCNLAWTPRLRVTGLSLKTEDETYTGRGNTLDDGRLLVQLTNGAKEMRMIGPVAKLKVEDAK
jgi:hypothetical protein